MARPKTATKTAEVTPQTIQIPALNVKMLELKVIGDSPLISHKWSDKAKKMMLDKQMKKAVGKREAENPEEDYLDSLYVHEEGGYGFPSTAFKAAAVAACRFVEGIAMTEARGAFHVMGELVKIVGEPNPREDMVRLETGVADIRYRGEFRTWSAILRIRYNANVLSPEQIINLFNTAGFGVGVGEWRPSAPKSKSGSYGMFHVAAGDE